jgi:hypothetical protein
MQNDIDALRRGGQNVRDLLQGIVGDRDQDARGVAGQVGIRDRKHVLMDERRGARGSPGIAAGDGGDGLAAVVEKPSEGLCKPAGSGDSDTLHVI